MLKNMRLKSGENILNTIKELFGKNLTILEEQIDVDIQTEYFEYSRDFDEDFDVKSIIQNRNDIFLKHISEEDKKSMLIRLASTGSIETFRTIEKYIKDTDHNLHDWAKLALQENKLLLETRILNENQVLITTGLGGKGLNIRYFAALIGRSGKKFTNFQEEILQKESQFILKRKSGLPEKICFDRDICTITALVPIQVDVQKVFDKLIEECNQFGNFLFKNYLITNMKVLSIDEIREFISVHYNQLE